MPISSSNIRFTWSSAIAREVILLSASPAAYVYSRINVFVPAKRGREMAMSSVQQIVFIVSPQARKKKKPVGRLAEGDFLRVMIPFEEWKKRIQEFAALSCSASLFVGAKYSFLNGESIRYIRQMSSNCAYPAFVYRAGFLPFLNFKPFCKLYRVFQ